MNPTARHRNSVRSRGEPNTTCPCSLEETVGDESLDSARDTFRLDTHVLGERSGVEARAQAESSDDRATHLPQGTLER